MRHFPYGFLISSFLEANERGSRSVTSRQAGRTRGYRLDGTKVERRVVRARESHCRGLFLRALRFLRVRYTAYLFRR